MVAMKPYEDLSETSRRRQFQKKRPNRHMNRRRYTDQWVIKSQNTKAEKTGKEV